MKKIFKIILGSIIGIIVLLYLTFLFVLPNVIDLNQYKSEIQKIVKEQSRLNLEYNQLKLVTTPYLAAGVQADGVTLKLPDNSLLFSADNVKTAVSLPNLLLFKIKVSFIKIDKPFINAEIIQNGEDYKIVKIIENIINDNKEKTFAVKPVEEDTSFDISSFKIILPRIILNNYKILVTDLNSKHYLDLHGEKLVAGYFNGERLKFKTNAELYSDKNKNVSLNINVNTFLPEGAPKLDKEDDPAEKVDFPFINPVTTYQNYDLKANIDTKIKIKRDKYGKISSFGYFNIEDLTMKISTVQLPKSYFRLKTYGTVVDTDTNIYTHENENLSISGKLKYGKNPNANIKIKTSKIKFENILALAKAVLDSMQIPNELAQYNAQGSIFADCILKTNFKKLNSDGFIKIHNGGVSVKHLGKIISDMNVNMIFSDNIMDISNSEFYIGNSPVKINGLIDKKSYTNIDVTAKDVPLPLLFNAFAPKQIRNSYNFKSGNISSALTVSGKMKEAVIKADTIFRNFDFSDKKNSFALKNKKFNSSFSYDTKQQTLTGEIYNELLQVLFPKTSSSIKIPHLTTIVKDGNVYLKQNIIYFNDKSAFISYGKILNYENPQDIDFTLNGEVNANDIIKFIGNEMKPLFNAKGNIPLNLKFSGNNSKQTLFAQALGNNNNYITPVDFTMLQNLNTALQATIDFKPNRIKIKDTGLYTIASVLDGDGRSRLVSNKIMGVDGTIENETVNLLKVDIPKALDGKIFVFPNSKFNIENTNLYVYGKASAPLLRGDVKIKNINIPEILTTLDTLNLSLKGTDLYFNLNKLLLNNSDLDIQGRVNLISDNYTNIYDFIVSSNIFKVEDASTVSEKLMAYMPQSSSSSNSQGIPVEIHNGIINFKKITTGNIELANTKSDLTLSKNILALRRISTDIFNGKTTGNVLVNLNSMLINTDLRGNGINVKKALLDSSGVKDSLSGTASYIAKLVIDGSAKTVEEQMKGISGNIDFSVNDGQFGPFGKLENLILAENIRESQFFQTALGGIIDSLATIDTTHFSELKGHISLKNGICNIEPITSLGNVMNLHILGKFDLLKNYADMKVRVKLTSVISNLLGPLNAINPVNLINSAASMNVVTAKAFSLFCETVSEEEMNIMPKFSNSYVDSSATKFQLGVRGDVAKPLTLIKSFKWLATQMQFNIAKNFADSLPDPVEGNESATIEETIQQVEAIEAEKKTLKYKIKHLFIRDKENSKNVEE